VQGSNARCQIRINLFKKDGRRAQISSVGRKLLNEIQPWSHCTLFAEKALRKIIDQEKKLV
jgi:hypothetical protein